MRLRANSSSAAEWTRGVMTWTAMAAVMAAALAGAGVLSAPAVLAAETVEAEAGGGDVPPVFSDVSLSDAIAQTKDGKKIAVVKFTADWCPPCKRMDKTTWREDAVVKWVKDNGVAIQVDVDKKPDEAQAHRVEAMPTMVVFVKGEEFDRAVGFMSGEAMTSWLEGVKAGKKRDKPVMSRRAAPDSKPTPGGKTVDERMEEARGLASDRKFKEAADAYAWLWTNMLEYQPSMLGVRGSFMANEMERLAERDAGAKATFTKLRDDAEARLKGEQKTMNDLDDWVVLNDVVGEPAKTLAWFDRVKDDAGAAESIQHVSFRLEPLLIENKRWADVPRLVGDPLAKVDQDFEQAETFLRMTKGRGDDEEMQNMAMGQFREGASALYAGLLAAGRAEDAGKVAAHVLKKDDTGKARVALVTTALKAGQAKPVHLEWLAEAGKKGEAVEGLTKQVSEGLGARGQR